MVTHRKNNFIPDTMEFPIPKPEKELQELKNHLVTEIKKAQSQEPQKKELSTDEQLKIIQQLQFERFKAFKAEQKSKEQTKQKDKGMGL